VKTAQELKIYLKKEDGAIGRPPLELTEELAKFCGITKAEHILLLAHILVQDGVEQIHQDLQQRGLLAEAFETNNVPSTQLSKF
jgi:hypothetical protein